MVARASHDTIYDSTETWETSVRILPWANSGHVTITVQWMSLGLKRFRPRAPMLTLATKKLSTGANGQIT